MKLIETVTTKSHIAEVFSGESLGKSFYKVIPKRKYTDYPYPVANKIRNFNSREDVDHYIKTL